MSKGVDFGHSAYDDQIIDALVNQHPEAMLDARPEAVSEWLQRFYHDRSETTRRLAHPVRHLRCGALFEKSYPGLWEVLVGLRDKELFSTITEVVRCHPLMEAATEFLYRIAAPRDDLGAHAKATLVSLFMAEWHRAFEGASFQVTRGLITMLNETDEARVPVQFLRPPFPATFIRLADDFDSSGCRLEGVYIFSGKLDERRQEYQQLYFSFVTQVDTSAEANQLSFTTTLREESEDKTLRELFQIDFSQVPGRGGPELTKARYERGIDLLGKVLMYMNSREQRLNDGADAEGQPTWKHGRAVPESVRRAFVGGRQPLLIGPEKWTKPSIPVSTGREMPVHWRRGHFRHVRYGIGRAEVKLMYFQPVLVNADKLSGETPQKKAYKVGPRKEP